MQVGTDAALLENVGLIHLFVEVVCG